MARVSEGVVKKKKKFPSILKIERRRKRLLGSEALLHPTSGNFEIALGKTVKPSVNRNFVKSLNNRTHTINDAETDQLHQSFAEVRLSAIVNRKFLSLIITNYKGVSVRNSYTVKERGIIKP